MPTYDHHASFAATMDHARDVHGYQQYPRVLRDWHEWPEFSARCGCGWLLWRVDPVGMKG